MYVQEGFKIVVRKRTIKWRQSNCSGETIRNMLGESMWFIFEMNNKEQTIANEDNSVEEQ